MSKPVSKPTLQPRRTVIAVILALTVVSGVVHGYLDGRWVAASSKVTDENRLANIPESFSDWKLLENSELDSGAQNMLRCYDSVVRVYQHVPTGVTVTAAVLHGPRGPIAVHRPEICYSSVGTDITRDRRAELVDETGKDHRLWSVEFQNSNTAEKFEVWYAWTVDGVWTAAENPRFWLTDDLYKIQFSGPAAKSGFDPCKSFVTDLLPHLEKVIH